MPEPKYSRSEASFSPCGLYRYTLLREWDAALPRAAFFMLNPSTADASVLDPTLRRCLGFAQAWGCGSFEVGNLFALRSTDPKALYSADDPVGPENDRALVGLAGRASYKLVCGWGAHGGHLYRADSVRRLLSKFDLFCLGLTKAGMPVHPLYLRGDLVPLPYRRAQA